MLRLIYSFCLSEMEIKVVICFNASRKMYCCCTAEKWQSAVNETVTSESESESELLLVTRSNDNHSPGPVMREVSP